MLHSILRPVIALQDQPQFVEAFSRIVGDSAGKVCVVCGLERMGHGPESRWLGYAAHGWDGIPTDTDGIANARKLTALAYRSRNSENA